MRPDCDRPSPGSAIVAASDQPPIDTLDPSALVELRVAGGRDFVALLIDQFLDESDALVAALRSAVDARRARQAVAAARQLRICAQSIGVMRLAALCANLEASLHGQPDGLPETGIMLSIERELQRAQRALALERSQLGGEPLRAGVKRPWE
jgi:HPt (histidine-containing phosphotransfer) domain-containing protein